MFRVIGPLARRRNRDLLNAMFGLREAVVSAAPPGLYARAIPEPGRDRFDTDRSVYVLAGEGRDVRACVRLNPTTAPHMLGEFLAPLCKVPSGPEIWECSRLVIDTVSVPDPLDQFRLRGRLGLGITAWCLDEKIRQLIWLIRHESFPQVAEIFPTRPLCDPIRLAGGGGWVPAVSEVGLGALDHFINRLRIPPETVAGLIAAGLDQTGGCIA